MSHDAGATAAPQTHDACQIPWSGGFDRIFRNEKAAGSNPASSTISPCTSWRNLHRSSPGDGGIGEWRATDAPHEIFEFMP
jgi:hypothetical protein